MDIFKYFRESLGLRDSGSRMYLINPISGTLGGQSPMTVAFLCVSSYFFFSIFSQKMGPDISFKKSQLKTV